MSIKILKKQATVNIGVIGHVAHGKSTIVHSITGIQTVRFKNELERNITIKLGYANAKFFKCKNLHCPRPGCFKATSSLISDNIFCNQCHYDMDLVKHVSFVDCPGHEVLMATMLSGASIMDAGLLVIAANEICPQPQTAEHLIAVEIMKMKKLIIIQNKVDLVSKNEAIDNYHKIKKFISKTSIKNSIIIPISAQRKCNIDVLIGEILKNIPSPKRNFSFILRLFLVRSFDINKPGCRIQEIKGGIVGGTILSGILSINDKIEIRPGITVKTSKGKIRSFSLKSTTISLSTEKNSLKYAIPGGLIGIGTNIDPTLTRADRLIGQILGHRNFLPDIYIYIIVKYRLFKRLIGISDKNSSILPLCLNEILMVNIGNSSTGGKVLQKKKNLVYLSLTIPICCQKSSKITISRRIDKHWRLIGWGEVLKGKKL
nr:eukaryotic translation initiation factor gamma SU [Cryptomonas curvata]